MQFDKGVRLGPYTIVSLLGAGGMGEVYEAHDTRLGRGVALKVLLPSLLANSDGRARFDREARALAALNHPNIATLHGVDECDGRQVLVMELVNGETLADRLRQGALPVADAIEIARQIAEALDAAHARGIVHRDLKPANVKITADGTVKLLDFGLATALRSTSEGAITGVTATTMVGATQEGMLLGTAAYMSPEQARGLSVDHRSDVFAFGSVLFEMLTGRPPFAGGTLGDLLAAVLTHEPDYSALPPTIDPRLAALVRRCLDKAPRRRWQAMGDVRHELEAIVEHPLVVASDALPAQVAPSRRSPWIWLLFAAAGALVGSALTAGVAWRWQSPAPLQVSRFVHTLPELQDVRAGRGRTPVAISPDGRRLAFASNWQVYIRELASNEATPLAGSFEPLLAVNSIAFSPDGRSIAYYSLGDGLVRRIPVSGGNAVTICQVPALAGLAWHGDHLLFAAPLGIMRVSANGGTPGVVVRLPAGETAYGPQVLPGGTDVLYSTAPAADIEDRWSAGQVVVQTMGSDERTVVVASGARAARYLPSGHIIYATEGVVLAVPFSVGSRQVLNMPVPVVRGVSRSGNGPSMDLAVSDTGTVVYRPGPTSTSFLRVLSVFDRTGAGEAIDIPPGLYAHPRLSRDGRFISYSTNEPRGANIWVLEKSGANSPRQLTFDGNNRYPAWSADGRRVAFQSDRAGDAGLFWQAADGSRTAERLTGAQPGTVHIPQSASPDGAHLLYDVVTGERAALHVLSLQNGSSSPFGSVTSNRSTSAAFSPDGRWVAYSQGVSAFRVLYVQPFPATGAKYRIAESASHPVWSSDGRELFYTPGPLAQIARVAMTASPSSVQFTPPTTFPRSFRNSVPWLERPYDVTPDGRFLSTIETVNNAAAAPSRLHIVLNWFDELRAIAPPPR